MCLHDILNFSEGLAAVVKEMSGRNGEREGGREGEEGNGVSRWGVIKGETRRRKEGKREI